MLEKVSKTVAKLKAAKLFASKLIVKVQNMYIELLL